MRNFRIDWGRFLGFTGPWSELAREMREKILTVKPGTALPDAPFHGELVHLREKGVALAAAGGKQAILAEAFHETHKVLRSLHRHPLLQHPTAELLRAYLAEHYTHDERAGMVETVGFGWGPARDALLMARVVSAGHLRGFLGAAEPREWERELLPDPDGWSTERELTEREPLIARARPAAELRCLLEALAADPAPIRFRDLEARVSRLPLPRLGSAIHAALRYLLCFAALDAELEPVLMLWPAVSARLHRPPAPPPAPADPGETSCLAWALEDLVQLLVRAAEPLRVKSTGRELFAAVERELQRGLLPLPPWLSREELFPENSLARRVRAALDLARRLGFTEERGQPGRDLGLATSASGWEWLELAARERLRVLLDLYRPPPAAGKDGEKQSGEDEEWPWDEDEEEDDLFLDDEPDFPDCTVPPPSPRLSDSSLFGGPGGQELTRAAVAAFATLEPGRPVQIDEFLAYHREASNPLRAGDLPWRMRSPAGWTPLTEEILEDIWLGGLQRILHDCLLPLGGVRAGVAGGSLTVELTSAGRYVLGLADDFVLADPAPRTTTPVRVQPDFEVVFVSESPALEAAIGRFAERKASGIGVLFRITRASILSAAQAGLGAEEVLATLAQSSAAPIPPNVEHEIYSWFDRCRRLWLEPAHLLRCPDAETAARVLAAAGTGKLELLSDTVLALLDRRHKASVLRACRKAGLFLHEAAEAAPGRRERRRRARWR